MSEIPDVAPGEVAAAEYHNDLRDRIVSRYANATERDTEDPTPADGAVSTLTNRPTLDVFQGGAWRTAGAVRQTLIREVTMASPGIGGNTQQVNYPTFTDLTKMAFSFQGVGTNSASKQAICNLETFTLTSSIVSAFYENAPSANATFRLSIVEYW